MAGQRTPNPPMGVRLPPRVPLLPISPRRSERPAADGKRWRINHSSSRARCPVLTILPISLNRPEHGSRKTGDPRSNRGVGSTFSPIFPHCKHKSSNKQKIKNRNDPGLTDKASVRSHTQGAHHALGILRADNPRSKRRARETDLDSSLSPVVHHSKDLLVRR